MMRITGIVFIFYIVLFSAIASAGELAPVLYLPDDCLMGATIGGKWRDGKSAAPQLGKSARAYQLYAQSGRTKTQTCSAPDPDPEGIEPGRAHDFTVRCGLPKSESPEADPFLIGIGENTTPFPRQVTFLTGNPAVYRKAVQEYLQSRIPNAPVTLDHVVRVDLEGDGTEEVLIEAHHFNREKIPGISGDEGPLPRHGKAGWYSIILLRKLVGKTVQTIPIAEEVYVKDGSEYEGVFDEFGIVGVFDVDGDGRFELVLRNDYYEGSYTNLIRLDGHSDKKAFWKYGTVLASCGWGA